MCTKSSLVAAKQCQRRRRLRNVRLVGTLNDEARKRISCAKLSSAGRREHEASEGRVLVDEASEVCQRPADTIPEKLFVDVTA